MKGMEGAIIVLCPHCEEEQEIEIAVRKTVCRSCGKIFDVRKNAVAQPDNFLDNEEPIEF